eukprot:gnl/Chilomastix_cuspidata/716.p1 GENE.gnl/Chilomastix_cuspidata/716~~gnl/Chilomastix_cuspidata/716.p1  ORF type:complete len:585 (-),score=144.07 gnl/Chilomastix_cuspidata/716:285-2039(-)
MDEQSDLFDSSKPPVSAPQTPRTSNGFLNVGMQPVQFIETHNEFLDDIEQTQLNGSFTKSSLMSSPEENFGAFHKRLAMLVLDDSSVDSSSLPEPPALQETAAIRSYFMPPAVHSSEDELVSQSEVEKLTTTPTLNPSSTRLISSPGPALVDASDGLYVPQNRSPLVDLQRVSRSPSEPALIQLAPAPKTLVLPARTREEAPSGGAASPTKRVSNPPAVAEAVAVHPGAWRLRRGATDAGTPVREDATLQKKSFFDMATDQEGSRHLQQILVKGTEKSRTVAQLFFEEVLPRFAEIMKNPFGNYVCQKVIALVDEDARARILLQVSPALGDLSVSLHGTRCVQALIRSDLTRDELAVFKKSLAPHVVRMICDSNGNHVINAWIDTFPSGDCAFIFETCAANCERICTHQHGCCIYQACIGCANATLRDKLARAVADSSLLLIQDRYGNYVVQFVLRADYFGFDAVSAIICNLEGHELSLCHQKFSSNVMEKCVKYSSGAVRARLIATLLAPGTLLELIQGQFSNYVIQSVLREGTADQRLEIAKTVSLHPSIRKLPYCRQIFALCEKQFPHIGKRENANYSEAR